jgi:phenylalanyl-tRNA synthetase beta subunit
LTQVLEKSEYKFTEIPKFPGIHRELNFVFSKNMPVGEIAKKITKSSQLISNVEVVDIYEDVVKVGENLRSVTFSYELRDMTKTITDEEALSIQQKVIANLEREGISLRK